MASTVHAEPRNQNHSQLILSCVIATYYHTLVSPGQIPGVSPLESPEFRIELDGPGWAPPSHGPARDIFETCTGACDQKRHLVCSLLIYKCQPLAPTWLHNDPVLLATGSKAVRDCGIGDPTDTVSYSLSLHPSVEERDPRNAFSGKIKCRAMLYCLRSGMTISRYPTRKKFTTCLPFHASCACRTTTNDIFTRLRARHTLIM